MKARELELKDICGYLPHGLYVDTMLQSGAYCNKILGCMENGTIPNLFMLYRSGNITVIMKDAKPILRPSSDLYKTITHNGKEIIPILECAKMSVLRIDYPNSDWIFNSDENCCVKIDAEFEFTKLGFWATIHTEKRLHANQITNQFQLFDYLNELKIDYRGLIDAGLAVDCNTSNVNPYK
jgi:hypothetical protein